MIVLDWVLVSKKSGERKHSTSWKETAKKLFWGECGRCIFKFTTYPWSASCTESAAAAIVARSVDCVVRVVVAAVLLLLLLLLLLLFPPLLVLPTSTRDDEDEKADDDDDDDDDSEQESDTAPTAMLPASFSTFVLLIVVVFIFFCCRCCCTVGGFGSVSAYTRVSLGSGIVRFLLCCCWFRSFPRPAAMGFLFINVSIAIMILVCRLRLPLTSTSVGIGVFVSRRRRVLYKLRSRFVFVFVLVSLIRLFSSAFLELTRLALSISYPNRWRLIKAVIALDLNFNRHLHKHNPTARFTFKSNKGDMQQSKFFSSNELFLDILWYNNFGW